MTILLTDTSVGDQVGTVFLVLGLVVLGVFCCTSRKDER